MVDLSDKGSESEDMLSSQSPTPDRASSDGSQNQIKTCVDCGTSKTPLWRGGPAGPKSLCNACGIRSRKKRRALLGINKEEKKPKKKTTAVQNQSNNNTSSTGSSGDSTERIGEETVRKKKLFSFGREVGLGLQRPRSSTFQRRKLGEVEQAAALLMFLSCGSVYA